MAVVESRDFWLSQVDLSETYHPPAEWARVSSRIDYFSNDDHWQSVFDWFDSDETSGMYCWHYKDYLNDYDDATGTVWAFSDAVTAMAFKIRFG